MREWSLAKLEAPFRGLAPTESGRRPVRLRPVRGLAHPDGARFKRASPSRSRCPPIARRLPGWREGLRFGGPATLEARPAVPGRIAASNKKRTNEANWPFVFNTRTRKRAQSREPRQARNMGSLDDKRFKVVVLIPAQTSHSPSDPTQSTTSAQNTPKNLTAHARLEAKGLNQSNGQEDIQKTAPIRSLCPSSLARCLSTPPFAAVFREGLSRQRKTRSTEQ